MSGNTHTDILLIFLVATNTSEQRRVTLNFLGWVSTLAGACAAFVVDLLVYPLDTLKTRFQSPDYHRLYYNTTNTAVNKPVLFRGLYQGVGSVILITIPSSGAFFTTYEATKNVLKEMNPTLNGSSKPFIPDPVVHSAASSIAELVSCFILTPAEVIKQNSQMMRPPAHSKSPNRSIIFQPSVTLVALRRFKKPSQLWRGYVALAARNLPFTAMQFPMFEHLKESIKTYRQRTGVYNGTFIEHVIVTGASAGVAGSVAAVITTPVDVVKTRIMLAASGDVSAHDGKKAILDAQAKRKFSDTRDKEKGVLRKSGFTVAREIMEEGGVKMLFRGGILRGSWTAIGSGLYLSTYEASRIYLRTDREESHVEDC